MVPHPRSHHHPRSHYQVLCLEPSAAQDDIKQAYRRLVRERHPDKGGDAASFAQLQTAYQTLGDPRARAAYDAAAASYHKAQPFGPVGGGDSDSPTAPGAVEAVLLQQLLARGAAHPCAVFNPLSQLCITCEVCRRPATQQCWTCGMDICELCTRTQHGGAAPLHWPLVNQPGSMLEQLGRRELELKRREDGQAYKEAQPDYRPQADVQVLRQFQQAVVDIITQQQQQQQQQTAMASAPATPVGSSSSSSSITASAYPGQQQLHAQPQQEQHRSAFALPPAGALLGSTTTTTTVSTTSANSSSKALTACQPAHTALAVKSSRQPTAVNKCWRAWQGASAEVRHALLGVFDNRLARFYMWAQTECAVLLALHLPTGGGKVPQPALTIDPSPTCILIQHQGFAPVLNRAWAHPIDAAAGVSSWTSLDGQLLMIKAYKAQPGRAWTACFKGDPHLARHLQSPYRLIQVPNEVQLELPVPFWVQPAEDISVHIGERQLRVAVDGVMTLHRTYSWAAAQAAKQGSSYKVVDQSSSSWCLLDSDASTASSTANTASSTASSTVSSSTSTSTSSTSTASTTSAAEPAAAPAAAAATPRRPVKRPDRVLSISLALPDPTPEEVAYKKGVRQNNAAVTRSCPNGAGKMGVAFFLEDEDEWGLQGVLQALLHQELQGRTWLTPRPWELAAGAGSLIGSGAGSSGGDSSLAAGSAAAGSGYWVSDEKALPPDVLRHLQVLRGAAAAGAAEAEGGTQGAGVAALLCAE